MFQNVRNRSIISLNIKNYEKIKKNALNLKIKFLVGSCLFLSVISETLSEGLSVLVSEWVVFVVTSLTTSVLFVITFRWFSVLTKYIPIYVFNTSVVVPRHGDVNAHVGNIKEYIQILNNWLKNLLGFNIWLL